MTGSNPVPEEKIKKKWNQDFLLLNNINIFFIYL
jgi:hypothetical protein